MRFLYFALLFFGSLAGNGEREILFTSPEFPELKIPALVNDGAIYINTDAISLTPGQSISFGTLAFANMFFFHDLTTAPGMYYRGISIDEIVSDDHVWSYEKILALLFYGNPVNELQTTIVAKNLFKGAQQAAAILHTMRRPQPEELAEPMDFFVRTFRTIVRQSAFNLDDLDIGGAELVGAASAIGAYMNFILTSRSFASPKQSASFADNFIYMAGLTEIADPHVVSTYLGLLVGHGMNFSTSLLLQMASAKASLINTLDVALRALDTPSHGGAAYDTALMMARIDTDYNGSYDAFLASVKSKREVLFGFGHRIYRSQEDPRAQQFERIAKALLKTSDDQSLSVDIKKAFMLKERALTKIARQELPPLQMNVDYFAHLILRSCGIDPRLGVVMFAIPRMGSWFADLRANPSAQQRLKRPQEAPFYRNTMMR